MSAVTAEARIKVPSAAEIKAGYVMAWVAIAVLLVIGAGASWFLARTLYDAYRADDWVQVKATVDGYDRRTVGYHYEFGGALYRGDRLSSMPIPIGSNNDSWIDDLVAGIASAYRSNKPIAIWVNPHAPAESMVSREIRWGSIVGGLVLALGFLVVGLASLRVMTHHHFGRKEGSMR